jgi:DNA-binding response OmpR family regulator
VPRKKNILLVDDDIAVREALVNALQTENYHVLQVADGEAAIQLLLDNPIDIALLDLGLENECGWDVFQQLIEIHPLLRTIIISGEPERFDHSSAPKVADMMAKPLNLSALLNTLNKIASESPKGSSVSRKTSAVTAEECVVSNEI